MTRPDARRRRAAALGAPFRAAPRAALAGVLAACSACSVSRPVALTPSATPEARGAAVRVSFAAPPDLVLGLTGGDSIRLRGVRQLEGRLDRHAGDTLLLHPLTRAVTAAGPVDDLAMERAAARVALGAGVTAAATRRKISRTRTALLVGGLLLLTAVAVFLWGASDGWESESGTGSGCGLLC